MFQIPWKLYSEAEILEVLTEIFRAKGYKVYNIHKIDRRGEQGVDMECTKPAENEKVILAVKKKPKKSDVGQLEEFAKRPSTSRIYVFIDEPSTAFKNVMDGLKNRMSFWNAETLTYELFCTDLRFYLFMVLENSFEKQVYKIIYSFFNVYKRIKKIKVEQPLKATPDMLNLLWAAKDRSSSLHKSLRTLQLLFEGMSLSEVTEETRKAMTFAFLESIENLKWANLDQLRSHFSEFMDKYSANFEQFCKQTKGRSNWTIWARTRPTLSPGHITKSLESGRESAHRMKEFSKRHDTSELKPPSLSEILGDVARILANEVDMFEETVDDLFSIGLFGKWDDMREEFARMSKERSNELRNAIRKELNVIKEEIDQKLKDELFQTSTFSIEVFTSYEGELKQHLCLNDFLLLQKTYSKIIALKFPTNLLDVNKRMHEEARNFIDKATKMLDKKNLWNDIKARKSFS
jgi:gas vesicle protein